MFSRNKKHLLTFGGALALIFLLGGCVSLSKEDCDHADYEKVGEREAVDGLQPFTDYGVYAGYVKSCAKYGSMDSPRKRYLEGYEVGRNKVCNEKYAYQQGLANKRFDDRFCPEGVRAKLVAAYKDGNSQAAVNKHAGVSSKAKCNFNSDCRIQPACTFNKCSSSGKECKSTADCVIEGRCSFGECKY